MHGKYSGAEGRSRRGSSGSTANRETADTEVQRNDPGSRQEVIRVSRLQYFAVSRGQRAGRRIINVGGAMSAATHVVVGGTCAGIEVDSIRRRAIAERIRETPRSALRRAVPKKPSTSPYSSRGGRGRARDPAIACSGG